MNRLRQIFCSKRAFTLIETIVAAAVSSIVLIGVLGFMLPTADNMEKTKQINNAKLVSEMILAELDKELKYANSIVIGEKASPPLANAKDIEIFAEPNGATPVALEEDILKIKRSGTTSDLVANAFYEKIGCTVTFTPATKGGLTVNIKTHLNYRKGTTILETTQVIKTYNGTATLAAGLTEGDYLVAAMPS